MNNPVCFFEIFVDDIARAKKFYESILSINLEKMDDPIDLTVDMWSFPSDFSQYGVSGALVRKDETSAGGNSTIVYFSCEDCAIEESRVENAGGKIVQSKLSIGEYGFCAIIIDTEGNTIGLHSQK